MKKALFLALAVLALTVSAHAVPVPLRSVVVSITGNTYNSYALGVTLANNERYATMQTRPLASWSPVVRYANSAAPNTYVANANYKTLLYGAPRDIWHFKYLGGSTGVYFNLTTPAQPAEVEVEVETFGLSIP
jgi:hypothetical protein